MILLAIGVFLFLQNNDGSTDQKNAAIASTSTNAYEAARQISENNRREVGGSSFGLLLVGMGSALTVFSLYTLMKKDEQ